MKQTFKKRRVETNSPIQTELMLGRENLTQPNMLINHKHRVESKKKETL